MNQPMFFLRCSHGARAGGLRKLWVGLRGEVLRFWCFVDVWFVWADEKDDFGKN